MNPEVDTIAAPATAPQSAVGIVRLSGPAAESIARQCFLGWPERPRTHRLYHGRIVHPVSGEVIDEALCVLMRGPNSFTGEDVVEFQGHGGAINLRRVVEATLAAGARPARPGEFTLRGFRNGRMDLTQAEAVADAVAAESEAAARAAQAQLAGGLKRPVEQLRRELLDLLALLEASLDFAAEEHVYQLPVDECVGRVEGVDERLARMLETWRAGTSASGAVRVVLAGEPNVGKSSLFNRMLGLDRAIVTAQAGTTRDVLADHARLGGHAVELVDTAGLRETADEVEAIGVARTLDETSRAGLVIHVLAADGDPVAALRATFPVEGARRTLVVVNKVDLLDRESAAPMAGIRRGAGLGGRQREEVAEPVRRALREAGSRAAVVTVSAATGEGIVRLERELASGLAQAQGTSTGGVPVLTSARHADAIEAAREALGRASAALTGGMPLELATTDVRDAADALGEVVGAIATDDVLERIFSSFCVGK